MIYEKREKDCDVSHTGLDSRNGFEGQMDVVTYRRDKAHLEKCQWRLTSKVELRSRRFSGSSPFPLRINARYAEGDKLPLA